MNTNQAVSSNTSMFNPFVLPRLFAQEHSRLTFQHHALRLGIEKIFLAPCTHPTAILDVACGCGTWTAEMGRLFPNVEIVGMDRQKPICPQSSLFQFIQGGTPSSLPFNDARFDYVHQRCLGTVIPMTHWQSIVNELVRVTQIGGWVELGEYGPYDKAGPQTVQWYLWWQAVLAQQSIDLNLTGSLAQLLKRAGLTHVKQETLSIPLSGGRAGEAMKTNLLAMIHGARSSILALGIDHLAFDQVVGALPKEWQECQTTCQFHVAYGQRESHKTLLSIAGHQRTTQYMRSSGLSNARLVPQLVEIYT